MSEIQNYSQAFETNFPLVFADQVLAKLETLYGADFDKKFGHVEAEVLRNEVSQVLNGVTPDQLRRGMQRMLSEKWCPTLPELRQWCIQDLSWWSADHAWAKALQFEAASNSGDLAQAHKPITKLTKIVLDEIRHIMAVEGQKAAKVAFKDIYNGYLKKAMEKGRQQEMWVPQPKSKQLDHDPERHRECVPCPEGLADQVRKKRLSSNQPTQMQQLLQRGYSAAEAYRISKGDAA